MPSHRRQDKASLVKGIVQRMDEHLARCHLMVYLKEASLQVTRMKYSELYGNTKGTKQTLFDNVLRPIKVVITQRIAPILQDLTNTIDNATSEQGA